MYKSPKLHWVRERVGGRLQREGNRHSFGDGFHFCYDTKRYFYDVSQPVLFQVVALIIYQKKIVFLTFPDYLLNISAANVTWEVKHI